jgi:hypothetical protein
MYFVLLSIIGTVVLTAPFESTLRHTTESIHWKSLIIYILTFKTNKCIRNVHTMTHLFRLTLELSSKY